MTVPHHATPSAESGDGGPLRLRGHWTLAHAGEIEKALRAQDGHADGGGADGGRWYSDWIGRPCTVRPSSTSLPSDASSVPLST